MDAFMQAQLAREAAASTRLDGETQSLPNANQVAHLKVVDERGYCTEPTCVTCRYYRGQGGPRE